MAGFQEAIRQFPNHTITYQRLASLLVRMGRVDDAAAQYLTVARAFHAHGVHAKSRPYFERVLELRPDHPEALERLMESLRSDGAEAEGERFVKAAAVAHLQAGRNEEAAAIFESLPDAQREGASALGAALLLQSGEVGQAERMAAQLELARPELRDWFKRLGRAALERGDKASAADAYFRWAQGERPGRRAGVVPVVAGTPAPLPAPAPEPPPVMASPPSAPRFRRRGSAPRPRLVWGVAAPTAAGLGAPPPRGRLGVPSGPPPGQVQAAPVRVVDPPAAPLPPRGGRARSFGRASRPGRGPIHAPAGGARPGRIRGPGTRPAAAISGPGPVHRGPRHPPNHGRDVPGRGDVRRGQAGL